MVELQMTLSGHLDDPAGQERIVLGPLESLGERRTVGPRVPFDQDEFGGQFVSSALGVEAVDEQLHSEEQVAAVVVVS